MSTKECELFMNHNLVVLLKEIVSSHKKRIKSIGITQRDFCKIAGIHENTLYNMKNPRINTLNKIEKALQKLGA